MRYRKQNNEPRNMIARYAGQCACCGAEIKAGEYVTYYPPGTMKGQAKGAIGHVGGLEGNGQRCYAELRKQLVDKEFQPDRDCYPDPGELAEDRWNEAHR